MIGDIDPIKAARTGQNISDELTVHYGLLPRANRGIFAINELPDLAGKIQVGLFNIMQEGDVQIKGYPVRLPLDVMLVFTANPEDYTARGKIITPLKDRIGSEIRTHYPATLEHGLEITGQEAWTSAGPPSNCACPDYIREIVEQLAFSAREDKKVDKRSGVSQRLPISVLENVASNAERRALMAGESVAVPRVLDVYAALPSITGKLELEYEGELKGGDAVARDLIRLAVGKVFTGYFDGENMSAGGAVVRAGRIAEAGGDSALERDGEGAGPHSGLDGEDRSAGPGRERAGCGARGGGGIYSRRTVRASAHQPQRRGRVHGRAAPPRAARRSRREVQPRGSISEVGPLFALHRRRFRPERRGSAQSAVGFFSRKRLPQPLHAVQRVESALARRSEARHRAGARARRNVRSRARRADPPAAGKHVARSNSISCSAGWSRSWWTKATSHRAASGRRGRGGQPGGSQGHRQEHRLSGIQDAEGSARIAGAFQLRRARYARYGDRRRIQRRAEALRVRRHA